MPSVRRGVPPTTTSRANPTRTTIASPAAYVSPPRDGRDVMETAVTLGAVALATASGKVSVAESPSASLAVSV